MCAGCGSDEHLLADCDATDKVLKKNGFMRGVDGTMYMGRGGVNIVCDRCHYKGHIKSNCPKAGKTTDAKAAKAATKRAAAKAERKEKEERRARAVRKAEKAEAKARKARMEAAEESESDASASDTDFTVSEESSSSDDE